jgi:hypothetical protein
VVGDITDRRRWRNSRSAMVSMVKSCGVDGDVAMQWRAIHGRRWRPVGLSVAGSATLSIGLGLGQWGLWRLQWTSSHEPLAPTFSYRHCAMGVPDQDARSEPTHGRWAKYGKDQINTFLFFLGFVLNSNTSCLNPSGLCLLVLLRTISSTIGVASFLLRASCA